MSVEDVVEGSKQLDKHAAEYRLAWSYYTGDRSEYFSGSSLLARKLALQGQVFRVNMARIPADAVSTRLEISNFDAGTDSLNSALQAVWDDNKLLFTFPELFKKTSALGDSYMMVWDNGDDGYDAEGNPTTQHDIAVTYHSPLSMRVVYNPEKPSEKLYAIQQWCTKSAVGVEIYRANIYTDEVVEKWVTVAGKKPGDDDAWVPYEDEAGDAVYAHDAGEIPVFHFRTCLQYGKPEQKEAYGAQDALNKLTITHMSTVDYHGFPQRYRILEASANPDDFFGHDDDILDTDPLSDADPEGQIRTGPATMWDLKGTKSVGQFDPAQPKTFTDPAEFYIRAMAVATDTPLSAFDPDGDKSGESRRREEGPLVKKVIDRQQLHGSELSALHSTILRLLGFGDVAVKITWKPAEMTTDKEGWATRLAQQEAGVPVRKTLIEAGYSPEVVDEFLPDDSSQGVLSVRQLQTMGPILKDLATAVTLNLLTAEEARAMLPPELLVGIAPDSGQ